MPHDDLTVAVLPQEGDAEADLASYVHIILKERDTFQVGYSQHAMRLSEPSTAHAAYCFALCHINPHTAQPEALLALHQLVDVICRYEWTQFE